MLEQLLDNHQALGTSWYISAELSNNRLESTTKKLLNEIDRFENSYSRFLPQSDIYQLNVNRKTTDASAELIELLSYGLTIYQLSERVFDISIGGILRNYGYGPRPEVQYRRSKNLLEDLIIDGNTITMKSGISLDLGGFGKGWLIDGLARILDDMAIDSYVINGGGDIRVKNNQIPIVMQHPTDQSMMIGEIPLISGGFAASSNQKRRWTTDGVEHGHIQDGPDNPIIATYVTAGTALRADVLATISFINPNVAAKMKQETETILLIDKDMKPILL
jgi:FAD:protein FMN transferase